ncbi:MAG TPA: hypothetical protein VFY18_03715 [Candidatus Limnocylindrales bacterium]|nr:hypothetical protein [Candidatus Limnocylindrales bacterium]
MSDRQLSERQIAAALAAHVPPAAPAGLHERIVTDSSTMTQQSPLPSILGLLFDADPVARRRATLLMAALLVILGLATAVAVGALLEQQRPRSIDPPPDLAAYIDGAYRGLADLPAFEMVGLEQGDRHRIHSNGRGTIRDERFSVNLTRIVSKDHVVELGLDQNGSPTLVDSGTSGIVPGLEIGRYMSLTQTCETPPVYLDLAVVIGRPTHHVRCGPREYWLDVDTRLVLRSAVASSTDPPRRASSAGHDSSGPSPAALADWEVTDLRIGPQPDELFAFAPPSGYAVVRFDDPACMFVGFATCTAPNASPASPEPYRTPVPVAGPDQVPADLDGLLASVEQAYAAVPALELVIQSSANRRGESTVFGQTSRSHHWADGAGRFRTQLSDSDNTIYITTGGHIWISYHEDNGSTVWRDNTGVFADHGGVGDIQFDFHRDCAAGWQWIGTELVVQRPAVHLACGPEDFWVDVERRLVVRREVRPSDPLELVTSIDEVVELRVGPQPGDLFELPPGAVTDPPTP